MWVGGLQRSVARAGALAAGGRWGGGSHRVRRSR